MLEATPGFEPGIRALQARALPLGYVALIYIKMVPGAGLEPARTDVRGILSPLRLPIPPSGQKTITHAAFALLCNDFWLNSYTRRPGMTLSDISILKLRF